MRTFDVYVRLRCPTCGERHDVVVDVCDGGPHTCGSCRREFELPKFGVVWSHLERRREGRRRSTRRKIRGRKKT